MTWIDVAIAVALLVFIVTGFQNGLIREVISIASTLGGVVLAGIFYDDFSDAFLDSIDNETTKQVVSFLVIFVGITVLGQLVAILVHPAVVIMQLGIADQLLGAGFGAAKGFVIVVSLLILMVTYPVYDLDEKIDDSVFAPRLLELANPILAILPEEFESSVEAFTSDIPFVEP
jgi:membrane protein required for colicin V production